MYEKVTVVSIYILYVSHTSDGNILRWETASTILYTAIAQQNKNEEGGRVSYFTMGLYYNDIHMLEASLLTICRHVHVVKIRM